MHPAQVQHSSRVGNHTLMMQRRSSRRSRLKASWKREAGQQPL
jgi:hypothetical protein